MTNSHQNDRDDPGAGATRERVTIRDVAAEADVSTTTVSRVLNGSSNVSNRTRRLVLDVIDELGFVPNASAERLARIQAGPRGGSANPDEREGGASDRSFAFEGAWTPRERAAVSEAIAESDAAEGVRICVKTQPGGRTLFVVVESRDGRWGIRTGDSLQELLAQFATERA